MKTAIVAVPLVTGLLAACATPEMRVRDGLIDAGLSAPVAGCMAERMVDRLSLGQLNKLGGLGKLDDEAPGDITMDEFIRRTRALQDPEIVGVATSSGVVCAVRGR